MSARVWQMRRAPNAFASWEERRDWRNAGRTCGNKSKIPGKRGCILKRGHRSPIHYYPRIGPVLR